MYSCSTLLFQLLLALSSACRSRFTLPYMQLRGLQVWIVPSRHLTWTFLEKLPFFCLILWHGGIKRPLCFKLLWKPWGVLDILDYHCYYKRNWSPPDKRFFRLVVAVGKKFCIYFFCIYMKALKKNCIFFQQQGELVTASKAIIEKEYQPKVIINKTGPNPFNRLTDQELEEYCEEVRRKQKCPEGMM